MCSSKSPSIMADSSPVKEALGAKAPLTRLTKTDVSIAAAVRVVGGSIGGIGGVGRKKRCSIDWHSHVESCEHLNRIKNP